MKIFKSHDSRIKNIIGRSFILSGILTLAIALIGSIYFNNSGLQILRKNNLQREQELLSGFLIPAITIADMTEVRRLLSLASDSNEKFVVIDNSGDILMSNYDDMDIVETSIINKNNTITTCSNIKTDYQVINNHKLWINCYPLLANNTDKKNTIGILISFSLYPSVWFSSLVFYFFGIAVASLLINTLWFRRVLNKKLLNPLTILGEKIIEIARSPFNSRVYLDGINNLPCEVREIKDAFQNVLSHLQSEYKQRTESEKKAALLDQAARVAHDIRSPIAVMEMSLYSLAEDGAKPQVQMMQRAVQSVRDIAYNLLDRYRDNEHEVNTSNNLAISFHDDPNVARPILLYSMIEQIISQKRYEWLQTSCELTFTYMPTAKPAWINVAPSDIKRMLSNLLNNAIEACENHIKIQIQLNKFDTSLKLSIIDNGIGISSENIGRYLNGESSKHSGKGLGLSSAKQYMESIGGNLEIISQQNNGTNVTLTFITDSNPTWNPSKINLSMNDIVIILDDDISMQTLWLHRLRKYPVKTHLFTTYKETIDWVKEHTNQINNTIFLVDYELSEKSTNGLMFLKHLNAGHRSYMITSHAEEVYIQRGIEKIGAWLIPKSLASEIPICFEGTFNEKLH